MAYYLKNTEKNGIEIYFGSKPDYATIEELKANRWKWFPTKNCWYNKDTAENESLALKVCSNNTVNEIMNEHKPTSRSATTHHVPSAPSKKYPTSKSRLDNSLFKRDLNLEKMFGIDELRLYGYVDRNNWIYIVGEIIAHKTPSDRFCLQCAIYDSDDDIIEAKKNSSYGSGVVTSLIKPASFFNGYPFTFVFWDIKKDKIKEILLLRQVTNEVNYGYKQSICFMSGMYI